MYLQCKRAPTLSIPGGIRVHQRVVNPGIVTQVLICGSEDHDSLAWKLCWDLVKVEQQTAEWEIGIV